MTARGSAHQSFLGHFEPRFRYSLMSACSDWAKAAARRTDLDERSRDGRCCSPLQVPPCNYGYDLPPLLLYYSPLLS